jgi:hypothetical protein
VPFGLGEGLVVGAGIGLAVFTIDLGVGSAVGVAFGLNVGLAIGAGVGLAVFIIGLGVGGTVRVAFALNVELAIQAACFNVEHDSGESAVVMLHMLQANQSSTPELTMVQAYIPGKPSWAQP